LINTPATLRFSEERIIAMSYLSLKVIFYVIYRAGLNKKAGSLENKGFAELLTYL
jgi:hypothetical protein